MGVTIRFGFGEPAMVFWEEFTGWTDVGSV